MLNNRLVEYCYYQWFCFCGCGGIKIIAWPVVYGLWQNVCGVESSSPVASGRMDWLGLDSMDGHRHKTVRRSVICLRMQIATRYYIYYGHANTRAERLLKTQE